MDITKQKIRDKLILSFSYDIISKLFPEESYLFLYFWERWQRSSKVSFPVFVAEDTKEYPFLWHKKFADLKTKERAFFLIFQIAFQVITHQKDSFLLKKKPIPLVKEIVEKELSELKIKMDQSVIDRLILLSKELLSNYSEELKAIVVEPSSLKEQMILALKDIQIIGKSKKFMDALNLARDVALSDAPVMITGESGTGKELIARLIHRLSHRYRAPFLAVNCGALPETLLESELFGTEPGAFTEAKKGIKKGRFELANGGTIFLDEITDATLSFQAKLLRVLQEKRFFRLGGEKELSVDVRIIAASNRSIESLVNLGKFREDLYFRLHVIEIHLPPLRERKEDIPLLAEFFLKKYNRIYNKNIKGFSKEVLEIFDRYSFPGNVRELENIIHRGVVLSKEEYILPKDIEINDKGFLLEFYDKSYKLRTRIKDLAFAIERGEGKWSTLLPEERKKLNRFLIKKSETLANMLERRKDLPITNSIVQKYFSCSPATAKNILNNLLKVGLIIKPKPDQIGRGVYYIFTKEEK